MARGNVAAVGPAGRPERLDFPGDRGTVVTGVDRDDEEPGGPSDQEAAAPGTARRRPALLILAVLSAALVVCCCSAVVGLLIAWSAGLFHQP
ncbi:hypothetical protein AB0C04_02460 [Micromonospora sp. NPDC048909]|uniref:hypothetical protein n=1 Tax=Micromonospora sp. NPDC048909 TaxID=3155643 RepID=UPI0033DE3E76